MGGGKPAAHAALRLAIEVHALFGAFDTERERERAKWQRDLAASVWRRCFVDGADHEINNTCFAQGLFFDGDVGRKLIYGRNILLRLLKEPSS